MKERIHNIKQFTLRRKKLRKESTKAEKLLWYKIRNKQIGYKFRRQHSIGKYIVDFYCPDLKLIIESDGPIHWTKEQEIHDKLREKYLRNQGFIILRYTDDQIKSDLDAVLQDIKNHCDKIIIHNQPPPTPSPIGSRTGSFQGGET